MDALQDALGAAGDDHPFDAFPDAVPMATTFGVGELRQVCDRAAAGPSTTVRLGRQRRNS